MITAKQRFLVLGLVVVSGAGSYATHAAEIKLPAQTVVYLSTSEPLIGKKGLVSEGQLVRCSVWRDVERDGRVIIRAGTPALAKIDEFKTRKVAGIKGKLSLAALETETVDGNTITLMGGYNKEGKGRIAMAASLSALVAWPTIFITGNAARLPAGTVFDSYTTHSVAVRIPHDTASIPVISLSETSDVSVEILYDKLAAEKKPKVFPLRITAPSGTGEFVIDTINGARVDPVPIEILGHTADGDTTVYDASVAIKPLSKQFNKGLNTVEVAFEEDGSRMGTELLIQIQF